MTEASSPPASCTACGAALERVFEGGAPYEQYDNALHVRFSGGYGEFVDAPFHHNEQGEGPDSLGAMICHDCAHALADRVEWISKILNPQRSHTHRQGREH